MLWLVKFQYCSIGGIQYIEAVQVVYFSMCFLQILAKINVNAGEKVALVF